MSVCREGSGNTVHWNRLVGTFAAQNICLKRNNVLYEGCSNMNASSFITFFTYMLRQNVIPFWKALFVAFKMPPSIKKH